MLTYKINIENSAIKSEVLEWNERYASPDCSFVTGVTSPSAHLEKHKRLSVESTAGNATDVVDLECENVLRSGFVIIKGKKYEVESARTVSYGTGQAISSKTYDYLSLNGKYYYDFGNSGYTVDHWLSCTDVEHQSVEEGTISAKTAVSGMVSLDTIAWVEDGFVTIDGEKYFFDKHEETENGYGCLKYYEGGPALTAKEITDCDSMNVVVLDTPKTVTKFKLTRDEYMELPYEYAGFADYSAYAFWKDNYCQVRKEVTSGTGDFNQYAFYCYVPKILTGESGETKYEYDKQVVYTVIDGNTGEEKRYLSGTGETYVENIATMKDLHDTTTYVDVMKDVRVPIESSVISTNAGECVIIHLNEAATVKNLSEGNAVRMVTNDYTTTVQLVSDDRGEFIVYAGQRIPVEKELCDTVTINGKEYDVSYPYGKVDGKDALVSIDGEEVPMLISGGTKTLKKYGYVLSGTVDSVKTIEMTYNIVPHDGIILNDRIYRVQLNVVINGETSGETRYVEIDGGMVYSLSVREIIGSSALVCDAYLNPDSFEPEFIKSYGQMVVSLVAMNNGTMTLNVPNVIFGREPLTPELPVARLLTDSSVTITSSSQYYDTTEDLSIFVNNQYINIPVMLDFKAASDPLQDDVQKNEFFKVERDKAINPIVDMERDVYTPKILKSEDYNGAETDFDPVYEIQVNLHFRTRDLDSWKVNEEYKSGTYSGGSNCNWFVTDYQPYKGLIESGNSIEEVSDLVGLMGFVNGDIYYQKTKVAKSFLRFSYYDTTDPNTQSLLHTSTVFMDEHMLFKKFIDNSRKGLNLYLPIDENKLDWSGSSLNKISTMTEMITKKPAEAYQKVSGKTNNKTYYIYKGEDHRMSSRFSIKNKYESKTSSEGFYLYIFKEYAEQLHPKPIYMKVEFNHAGFGKTIPFIVPMTQDASGFPKSQVSLTVKTELDKLKGGVPLKNVYGQSYIPMYAVYDYKDNEYVYVFDPRYVTVKDGVVTLNLYELKIMDESDKMSTDKDFVININEHWK